MFNCDNYYLRVSRMTKRGLGYFAPWHSQGSYVKLGEDRYENINRAKNSQADV